MTEPENLTDENLWCEKKCVYEFIECMEVEAGASICKTHERNCFNDCSY